MTEKDHCIDKTDEELVKLTLQNEDFLVCIIDRYKVKLFNYIRRLTNIDEEEAEDILQEVFIKAYLNLNDFNIDLKFSSWIYRITHNQVISNHRKLKSRPEGNSSSLENEEYKKIAVDLDIERDIDLDYLRKNIYEILDKLDAKHKEIIVLKFFEEKSYEEISDIIEKPMGTVASLLSKAKKEFSKELARQKIKL